VNSNGSASLPDVTPSASPGELVAVDLPPGPRMAEVLTAWWSRGVAVLPLDARLSPRERRAILDRASPAIVVTEDDEVVFADAPPVDEGVGAVVATSGTGGAPKLAELSFDAVRAALRSSSMALGTGHHERWVACLTPAHVGGLLVLLRAADGGHPLEVHERFDPERLAAAAPCWASVVPTMVRRLLHAERSLHGLGLLVGGGALDPAARSEAEERGARVVTTYGMTETCGGVAYDGVLFAGTRARTAPDGTVQLRGPTLMDGYRRDPQGTAEAFTVDGWLRTGDLGSVQDGRIEIEGRADDAIRTGGERVWPDEVEAVLREHPKVADAAVAGRPDADWGEHVAAWVIPRYPDELPTLEELRAHCRDRLSSFKAPRELMLVADIPRTSTGKIRRHALPAG
jgi:o-succinylbenzoate---CoA ligase